MIGFARQEMSRSLVLQRKFDLARLSQPDLLAPAQQALDLCANLKPGELVLITGASGSGKSLLMRQLHRSLSQRAAVSVAEDVVLPDVPVVDTLHWLELEQALSILCRFGLGEVYSYLAPVQHLSTGQRFRLRLAIAYARLHPRRTSRCAPSVLMVDEFATCLDRTSGAIIARNLSRVITASPFCAIVASCRDDLEKPLRPTRTIHCDFGQYQLHPREESR